MCLGFSKRFQECFWGFNEGPRNVLKGLKGFRHVSGVFRTFQIIRGVLEVNRSDLEARSSPFGKLVPFVRFRKLQKCLRGISEACCLVFEMFWEFQ